MKIGKNVARYLLVEIDDAGEKGIQSFQPSSRQAVVCRPALQTVRHQNASVDFSVISCPSQEDPTINGNFMEFHLELFDTDTIDDELRLVVRYIDIGECGESPPNECRCKSMITNVLSTELFVDEIRATFANRGNSMIPDASFLKMCRCFLGAAARFRNIFGENFNTVRMLLPGPQQRCNQEKRFTTNRLSSDFYGKVCEKLSKQGCEEMGGIIRKIPT